MHVGYKQSDLLSRDKQKLNCNERYRWRNINIILNTHRNLIINSGMHVGYKQSDLLSRDKQKLNCSIIGNQAAFFTIAV